MKFILSILVLFTLQSQAQIINASSPYRVTAAPVPCAKILDTYTSGTAGYSLRKLDCDYAGYAIKVRRAGDNAESDIGFTDNGDLDTATLKSFITTNSGYVTIWYDQTGNGKNAIMATSTYQPKIANAGVLYNVNNRPYIYFIKATPNYLATSAALFTGANNRSMWAVYKPNTTTSSSYAVCGQSTGSSTGTWFVLQFRSGGANGDPYLAGYAADLTGNDAISTDAKIVSANYDGTNGSLYKNDGEEQTAARSYNTVNQPFIIGASNNGTAEFMEGFLSEIIVWGVSQASNRSAIYSNINTYYTIY